MNNQPSPPVTKTFIASPLPVSGNGLPKLTYYLPFSLADDVFYISPLKTPCALVAFPSLTGEQDSTSVPQLTRELCQ